MLHVMGPYIAGSFPDRHVAASNWLNRAIPRGEYYFADAGYRDRNISCCVSRQEQLNDIEKRRFDVLMARHETVKNTRFKEWGILQQIYQHSEVCHGTVFNAIAVITQLDIEDGRPVWSF